VAPSKACPISIGTTASPGQATYIVAVAGSLLYSFLQATVLQIVWLRLPIALPEFISGIPGFALSWGLGMLFLLFVIHLFSFPYFEDRAGNTAA
jgi:hypothetical protein